MAGSRAVRCRSSLDVACSMATNCFSMRPVAPQDPPAAVAGVRVVLKLSFVSEELPPLAAPLNPEMVTARVLLYLKPSSNAVVSRGCDYTLSVAEASHVPLVDAAHAMGWYEQAPLWPHLPGGPNGRKVEQSTTNTQQSNCKVHSKKSGENKKTTLQKLAPLHSAHPYCTSGRRK